MKTALQNYEDEEKKEKSLFYKIKSKFKKD